jgi:hypothetical protein
VNAETFNALYEVGIPVFAYPGARPPQAARKLITRTRSRAWVADHGKPVVMVDGLVGWISLTHVDVVPEDEWEAANTADAVAAEQAPKEGSREWLEQLPRDERWAHTEVLAMYGEQVVNPSYDVALYHLRYAVAEVKRLTGKVAELESEYAGAIAASESLHRRLSEEQLAGSALFAALTMPTTPAQRQAALDKFTAVAQQVSGSETAS